MKRLPIGVMLVVGACRPGGWSEDRSTPLQGDASAQTSLLHGADLGLSFASGPAGFRATLSERGMALRGGVDSDALTLRLEAWGRAQSLRAAEHGRPAAAPCGAEPGCVSRMTQAHGEGLTGWWVGRAQGVEQGWTLERPPEGQGALRLITTVEGAAVLEGPGGVRLVEPSGRRWSVSAPTAWGADGRAAPAWLEVEGDRLVVFVDDADAAYPLTVDPLFSTAAITLTEPYSGEGYGEAVAHADVNGDGYDDLFVGATGTPPNGTGAVYVYYGTASGLPATPDDTLSGVLVYYYFGAAIHSAGDVNGDGYEDLIVGAPGNGNDEGRAYVFHGSASGVSWPADATLSGVERLDYFGDSVSSAGDINGDGYGDVVVGSWQYDNRRGRVYAFHGSADGVDETAATTIEGRYYAGGQFGITLAGVGDTNGDGYDDVLVGSPREDSQGRAYLYYGTAEGLSGSPWWVQGGNYDYIGQRVAAAGDVNGDGYFDVLIGVPGDERVMLLYGSRQGISESNGTDLPISGGYAYGYAHDGLGDVDGDGYADVAACGYDSASGDPRCWLLTGGASGVSTTIASTLSGDDVFGNLLVAAGDVNGDGFADLAVTDTDSSVNATEIDVYWGYVDADGDGDPGSTDCDDADASRHAGAEEVVGDGIDSDCDGGELCYTDGDDDGYRQLTTVVSADADCDDPGEALASEPTGDCDDSDPQVSPDGVEVCDEADADEDCDGLSDDEDDDTTGQTRWHLDEDGDGYGAEPLPEESCEAPEGAVADSSDCDDEDAAVYPGAPEVEDDGVDQDCDGADAQGTGGGGDDTGVGEGDKDGGCSSAPGGSARGGLLALFLLWGGRRRYTPR